MKAFYPIALVLSLVCLATHTQQVQYPSSPTKFIKIEEPDYSFQNSHNFFGWHFKGNLDGNLTSRVCATRLAKHMVLTNNGFSNGAELSQNVQNVRYHSSAFVTLTVVFFGAWTPKETLSVLINNKVYWTGPAQGEESVDCGNGIQAVMKRIEFIYHKSLEDAQITIRDSLSGSNGRSWGVLDMGASLQYGRRTLGRLRLLDPQSITWHQVDTWTVSLPGEAKSTQCGPYQVLGGANVFANSRAVMSLGNLGGEGFIKVTGTVVMIDDWTDSDRILIKADEKVVKILTRAHKNEKNICGDERKDEEIDFDVTIKIKRGKLDLIFEDTLQNDAGSPSWGIKSINLTALNAQKSPQHSLDNPITNDGRWIFWKAEKKWSPNLIGKCKGEPIFGGADRFEPTSKIYRCLYNVPPNSKITAKLSALLIVKPGSSQSISWHVATPYKAATRHGLVPPRTVALDDCGASIPNAIYINDTIEATSEGISGPVCFSINTDGGKDLIGFGIKSFDVTILPACHASCRTCSEWNKCSSCKDHAKLSKKIGNCKCKAGFYMSNIANCENSLARIANCNYNRLNYVNELHDSKLRYPNLLTGWTVRNHPVQQADIGACGKKRLLGGASLLKTDDSATRIWNDLPGHFKLQVNATVFIVDKNAQKTTPVSFKSVQLYVDNQLVNEVKQIQSKKSRKCGADAGRAGVVRVSKLLDHTGPNMNVTVRVELGDGQVQSWGLRNVVLNILTCPPGCSDCKSCVGGCKSCLGESVLVSGYCECPRGKKMQPFGNSVVCEAIGNCSFTSSDQLLRIFEKNITTLAAWKINNRPVDKNDFFSCGKFEAIGGPSGLKATDVVTATLKEASRGAFFGARVRGHIYVIVPATYQGNLAEIAPANFDVLLNGKTSRSIPYSGSQYPMKACRTAGGEYFVQEIAVHYPVTITTQKGVEVSISATGAAFENGAGWVIGETQLETCLCSGGCDTCSEIGRCASCKDPLTALNDEARCVCKEGYVLSKFSSNCIGKDVVEEQQIYSFPNQN